MNKDIIEEVIKDALIRSVEGEEQPARAEAIIEQKLQNIRQESGLWAGVRRLTGKFFRLIGK